jgi:hypothetical protein
LERLFDAFDPDTQDAIDFRHYISGLSVFSKGTAEEKLSLSFKLFDIDHDGLVSREDLRHVLQELYAPVLAEDHNAHIEQMVTRIFDDLDTDDDGRLSYSDFKLAAMKEPEFDLLGQFLAPPLEEDVPSIFARTGSMTPKKGVSRHGSLIINRSRSPVHMTIPSFEQVSSKLSQHQSAMEKE